MCGIGNALGMGLVGNLAESVRKGTPLSAGLVGSLMKDRDKAKPKVAGAASSRPAQAAQAAQPTTLLGG